MDVKQQKLHAEPSFYIVTLMLLLTDLTSFLLA